jgi:uncharacterized protein YbjT (DUF2867 family)
MNILIVGSTGQLGYAIAKKLHSGDHQVVAMHRPSSDTAPLRKLDGIRLVQGDLTDQASLARALKGIDVVISTANAVSPAQKGDTLKNVDTEGLKCLIKQATITGVKQFIYTSALPFGTLNHTIPLMRAKRTIELRLNDSGIPFTIFQPTAFMDVYFPFFGTDLPVNKAEVSTLRRPFKFSNKFFDGIKKDMEQKSRFNIVGKGNVRCSFITIDNVADFHVSAVGNPNAMNRVIPVGGPAALSPLEVKSLFEKALGKALSVKSTPLPVIWLMAKMLPPFNPHAANLMAMNYASAKNNMVIPNALEIAREFGVRLQSAEEYIGSLVQAVK